MSKSINSIADLISVDATAVASVKSDNAAKVKAVLDRKSKSVVDALAASKARDDAVKREFESLQESAEHTTLIKAYVLQNAVAVDPIATLDVLEGEIKAEYDAINARYETRIKDAQADATVAIHNVIEARAAVEALDMYPNILKDPEISLPSVMARITKRGRGRGRGGGARTPASDYVAGDTVYLQHADKITGNHYIWQTVATESGVMVNGVDTADSTAVFDLRTGVDDALRDQEADTGKPYHPGKAFKTYPPSGKGYVGVEIVNIE